MKFNFPANDYNSQPVASLVLIILFIISVMSCSLLSGMQITICSVSNVNPKNSTTVTGPSDFYGAIGICISWHTCLSTPMACPQTCEYL